MPTFSKLLVIFSTLLFSVFISTAQNSKEVNGSVQGLITTSDGKPAAYVTVGIAHTRWGVISDERGRYSIKNVKSGTWTLKVSAVAATAQEQQITIAAGRTAQADFVLKENAGELQEVTVSARNSNKENRAVAKMPLKNLENPQWV